MISLYCSESMSESLSSHKIKTVKSRIQRVNPELFIGFCLEYNNQKFPNTLEMLKHLPWIVNLAIKWSSEMIGKKRSFKEIDKAATWVLLQETYKNMDFVEAGLKSPMSINFFVRNMLYQQFYYQKKDHMNSIVKEAYIFGGLEDEHKLKRAFTELSGLKVNDFIILSLCVCMLADNGFGFLTAKDFKFISGMISKDTVVIFLNLISNEVKDLPEFAKINSSNSPLDEYFSPSPFFTKPLIKDGERYLQIHPNVTKKGLQNFIYDYLRSNNPEFFMNSYGSVFEKVIEILIKESNFPYVSEKQLKEYIPADMNVIDFVISDGESNILIDAKGVDLNKKGMVTLSPKNVASSIKTSVLKTFKQALSVNKCINEGITRDIKKAIDNYIICVTHKDLLLGDGNFIHSTFAGTEIDKIFAEYENEHHIPFGNFFCMSITEFENILSSCAYHNKKISGFFKYAVEKNKDITNSSFFISQHLSNYLSPVKCSKTFSQHGVDIMSEIAQNYREFN